MVMFFRGTQFILISVLSLQFLLLPSLPVLSALIEQDIATLELEEKCELEKECDDVFWVDTFLSSVAEFRLLQEQSLDCLSSKAVNAVTIYFNVSHSRDPPTIAV